MPHFEKTEINCRFCNEPLHLTFCNLGNSPLSNAYLSTHQLSSKEAFYPLHAYVCSNCLLVQLPSLHTPAEIFDEYAYFSSYSTSWLDHARQFADSAIKRFTLNSQTNVIEVASNDGYLLQFFKEQAIPVLGIEPAKNVAKQALLKGIPTRIEFFGSACAESFENKADLLIGNNVLAHVPDLNDFVSGIKIALKPTGVATFEFPHLLKLIEENQFDTIYHEHFSYFSLLSVQTIFSSHGLTIFDVDKLPTHGGSLRIYAKKSENIAHPIHSSVEELLSEEKKKGLKCLETYSAFPQRVEKVRSELLSFLHQEHRERRKVAGYGAPAKGNTLLNFCGLKKDLILFTVDRNPYKLRKFLPGSHIPILSVETIERIKPDYLLILPWNLKEEIMEQMAMIRSWGGKFVIPIPCLKIF